MNGVTRVDERRLFEAAAKMQAAKARFAYGGVGGVGGGFGGGFGGGDTPQQIARNARKERERARAEKDKRDASTIAANIQGMQE